MKQYQIWKSKEGYYAISSLSCKSIPPENKNIKFYATKLGEKYKRLEVIEREMRPKNALLDYLKPLVIDDGIHPIYNRIGEVCQQIVNVPDRIMSSDEVLRYLNDYTILPQENPPWKEIIYKLRCYSGTLSDEYFKRMGFSLEKNRKKAESQSGIEREMDKDEHYFVCRPKENEGKTGVIFHLENPSRPRRKWIILDEYYDYIKNAWVLGSKVSRRLGNRVDPPTEKKKVNTELLEIAKSRTEYYQTHEKPQKSEFDWRKLEVHPLAHLIPYPGIEDRARLKDDIEKKGILESLWLYEGKILDGRTRHELALELDAEGKLKNKPDFKPFRGPGSARSFVMSMGIHRRHLSSSQVAAIGVDQYLEQYEKEALERKKTNMNGANLNKSNMNTMHMEQIPDAQKGTCYELLADKLKTNSKYIQNAKLIKDSDPELFKKIISGNITITKAKSQLFPKKKKKAYKFENEYKRLLKIIVEGNLPHALIRLSKLFLRWNKRNDKKLSSELKDFENDYDAIIKQKPKLELITYKKTELKEG